VKIPFSVEAFYGVFTAYNNAVWPMQLPLLLIGIIGVVLLFAQRRWADVGISIILAILWGWQAVVYHLMFFAAINPLAYGFAALFMFGAAMFFWQGVVRRKLNFKPLRGWRQVAGACLIIFALVGYPLWTYLAGHRYPGFPTFGLPCPTTIFTLGVLAFLVKPYPRSVFVVPIIWCLIGSQAAFVFDLPADIGLIVAGIIGLVLVLQSKVSIDASTNLS
jgi:Family of unknown function (DUF6064)